jgi:prolyl-tRNA synthetase
VRIEIGPRDLAQGNVSLVRRDRREREPVSSDAAVRAAAVAVAASQQALLDEATAALRDRTVDVHDVDAAAKAAQEGLARLPWATCGPEGEQRLNRAGVSIRCVTRPDGSMPDSLDDVDLVAIAGRAY